MADFPDGLGCWTKNGFGNIAPRAKQFLGNRTYEDKNGKINARFVLFKKSDALELLNWWSTEVENGTGQFNVDLPFFRELGTSTVRMINDLNIEMVNGSYQAVFNLELIEAVSVLLQQSPPERITDLKALFNMDTAEVHLTWTEALFATSYDLYYNGFKIQTGVTSPFVTPYVGTGDYTIEAINTYGSSISNTATIRLSTFAFYYSGATAQYTNFQWIMPNLTQYQSPINAIMGGSNAIALNEGLDTGQYVDVKTGASLTRASIGSYIEQGYVKYAEIDEARFEDGFGLVEDEMINYIEWSDTFDPAQTFWSESRCVLTINDAIAPDGNMTASKMTASPNIAQNYYMRSINSPYPVTIPDNTICTESIFVKKGNTRYCAISVVARIGTQDTVYFDFDTNTFTSQSAFVLGSEAKILQDGWVRLSITFDLGVIGTSTYDGQMRVFLSTLPNNTKFDADGTEFMYLWGGQTEVGDKMTSYRTAITTSSFRASDIVDSSDCYMIRMNTNENRHEIIGNTVNGGGSKDQSINGDFTNGTFNWTETQATISVADDILTITEPDGVGQASAENRPISLRGGKTYTVEAKILQTDNQALTGFTVGLGNGVFPNENYFTYGYDVGTHIVPFLMLQDGVYFGLGSPRDIGQTSQWNYIKLTEAIPNSTSYRQTDSFSNMVALDILPTQGDLTILDNNPNALFETWMGVDHGLSFTALNIKHLYLGNEGEIGGEFIHDLAVDLGAEEITNGTFETDISGFQVAGGASITWDDGKVDIVSASPHAYGGIKTAVSNFEGEQGKVYIPSVEISNYKDIVVANLQNFLAQFDITENGVHSKAIRQQESGIFKVTSKDVVDNTFTVDNISVKELIGYAEIMGYTDQCRTYFGNKSIGVSNFKIAQNESGRAIAIGAENDLIGAKDGRFIDVGGAEYLITDCISGLYGDINTNATLIPCE